MDLTPRKVPIFLDYAPGAVMGMATIPFHSKVLIQLNADGQRFVAEYRKQHRKRPRLHIDPAFGFPGEPMTATASFESWEYSQELERLCEEARNYRPSR